LKKIKANIDNLGKTNYIFSVLFILFIFLVAYVLVIFFLKLNIVQTLFIFGVLTVPGLIISYKALSSINIDI
jgi:hypothetical protein